MQEVDSKVDSRAFFAEYHGHTIPHLEAVLRGLRSQGKKIIFLVGDSSLDNKHWLYPGIQKLCFKPF